MQSIQEWRQKIKNWTENAVGEWGLVAIVILLGLGSFGLETCFYGTYQSGWNSP